MWALTACIGQKCHPSGASEVWENPGGSELSPAGTAESAESSPARTCWVRGWKLRRVPEGRLKDFQDASPGFAGLGERVWMRRTASGVTLSQTCPNWAPLRNHGYPTENSGRPGGAPQIPPLRYAPVGMTTLLGNAKYHFEDGLSSRPVQPLKPARIRNMCGLDTVL